MNQVLFGVAACLLFVAASAKLPKIDPAGAFAEANTTKDAGVTPSELHAYLKKHGHTDIDANEAERLVRAVDINNDLSLTQDEFSRLIKYRNNFVDLDVDGDLKLASAELKSFFSAAGITGNSVEELIEEVDVDRDGFVDLVEFAYLAAIVDDFKAIDADDSKELSDSELSQYLVKNGATLNDNDLNRLKIAADDDNNGKIDIDEFAKIFIILDKFTFFDKSHDGELTKEELVPYFAAVDFKINDDDLTRLISVVDEDKNGKIDLDEFAFIYISHRAFKIVDGNHDGELTQAEVAKFFENVGFKISEADLKEVISVVDEDKNGTLDIDEFAQLVQSYKFFVTFDKSKDGTLDLNEWKNKNTILSKGTKDVAVMESHFKAADKNGDGKVTFPEFVKAFKAFKDTKTG